MLPCFRHALLALKPWNSCGSHVKTETVDGLSPLDCEAEKASAAQSSESICSEPFVGGRSCGDRRRGILLAFEPRANFIGVYGAIH